MKRFLAITLMVLFFAVPVAMADDTPYKYKGSQALYIASGSSSFTVPSGTRRAMITVIGDSIRWQANGTTPTAAQGYLLDDGDYLVLDTTDEIDNFEFVLDTGGSGVTVLVMYSGPAGW